MNEFLVDLLPDDARKHLRMRANLRLFKFSAALIMTVATGVVFNSVVELRKARAEHTVIVSLRDRASKIDTMVAAAALERTALQGELGADALLRSPVSTSEIIATVSSLLPQGSWLETLRVALDDPKTAKGAPPSRPSYTILLHGNAPTGDDLQELASNLRKTPPFIAVTVVEQRAVPRMGGGSNQQFVMRVRLEGASNATDAVVSKAPATAQLAHAGGTTR